MPLARRVELLPRQVSMAGATLFSAPRPSHEILIAEVSTSAGRSPPPSSPPAP